MALPSTNTLDIAYRGGAVIGINIPVITTILDSSSRGEAARDIYSSPIAFRIDTSTLDVVMHGGPSQDIPNLVNGPLSTGLDIPSRGGTYRYITGNRL